MNGIKIFENTEFGQIRTVVVNNEPMFVGSDIAKALGYAKPQNAIAAHVDDEDKKDAPIQGTLGGVQKMTVINESGMYSLVLSSKLDGAKKFKRWVTSEVLPSIRKTGGYMATNGTETDEELMARALAVAQETMKRRDERIRQLESANEEQQHLIEEKDKQIKQDQPKVTFANAVSGSTTSILIGELAKILRQNGVKDMGEKRLFAWLRDNHYLGTVGERYNVPNQQYIEQGLFELKTNTFSVNGEMKTRSTTKVTGKGQQYFVNKFLNQAS